MTNIVDNIHSQKEIKFTLEYRRENLTKTQNFEISMKDLTS